MTVGAFGIAKERRAGRMAEEEEWRGTCARLAEILAQDAGDTDEEAPLLERFTQAHAEEYTFGEEEHGRLLQALVHHRLHHQAFVHSGQHDALLRVLQALRVLLRDEALMASFTSLCDLRTFAQLTFSLVEQHLSSEPLSFSTECLVECTSILKKLTLFSRPSWPSLLREQCHVVLARLLRTSEGTLLPQALFILMELTSDNSFHSAFESIKLNESLLHIVQACNLCILLCVESPPQAPRSSALFTAASRRLIQAARCHYFAQHYKVCLEQIICHSSNTHKNTQNSIATGGARIAVISSTQAASDACCRCYTPMMMPSSTPPRTR